VRRGRSQDLTLFGRTAPFGTEGICPTGTLRTCVRMFTTGSDSVSFLSDRAGESTAGGGMSEKDSIPEQQRARSDETGEAAFMPGL